MARSRAVPVGTTSSTRPMGPPWAVSEDELDRLEQAGLIAESVALVGGGLWSDFVAVYRRP